MTRRVWPVVAVPLAVIALAGSRADAAGPLPLSQLHLDQASATFHAGAARETSGNCLAGKAYSAPVKVTLSAAADGTAVVAFTTPSIGRFSGPVLELAPGQLELTLVARPNVNVINTEALTGIGPTFSGPAVSTVTSPRCIAVSTDSLDLAGSGLTLLAPAASLAPVASPTPSTVTTPTAVPAVSTRGTAPPTSTSGFPIVPVVLVVVVVAGVAAAALAAQRRRGPAAERLPSHDERPRRPG